MGYRVITVDLSNANPNPVELIPPGQLISEVAFLTVPSTAAFTIAFGDNPQFTVPANPVSFMPRGDAANRGLTYANAVAQPGTTIQMIVGLGDNISAEPLRGARL